MKTLKFVLLLFSCISILQTFGQAKPYDFPKPVNTKSKTISYQEKGVFEITKNIYADNEFKGARLNSIEQVNDSLILVKISPENSPINWSPWYAFRIWSVGQPIKMTIQISYSEDAKHRYWPKLSESGNDWSRADSSNVRVAADTASVFLKVTIPTDTLWISAQQIVNSDHVETWTQKISLNENVTFSKAGKSMNKKKIPFIQITNGSLKGKDIIVCLSRQHPPEVTGYFALQYFIEKILDGTELNKKFLDKYAILVYPLMNPDGVDQGHWRHNSGGVDLNRDWAYYHQPEIRQVANHVVKRVKKSKGVVALGLDFHSTWYDVYYTTDNELEVRNQPFTDLWIEYIKNQITDYEPRVAPSGLNAPVSKGWFVSQFNAPGVTYEIGDDTPKEFIKKKSNVAAEGMMRILLELSSQ